MTAPVPRWQRHSTAAIVVLAVVSSLLGLSRPGHYPPELLPEFYVQDALVLFVGIPVLSVALRYAVRGSLRGRFVWLGALAYMAYLWLSIGLQVPFNRFFLGYVVLFALSLFTLVGGTVSVDADDVRRVFRGRLSERRYALVLAAVAAGLAALWLAELVPATLSGTAPPLVAAVGPQALVSHFVDLAVVVPGLAVAAALLRRRRSWGYVLAGVGLVFGALLAPTITAMTLVLVVTGDVAVPAVAVVFTVLPALVTTVFAVAFLRTVPGRESTKSAGWTARTD